MRHDVPAPGFKLTMGRKPRTAGVKLRVQFRCGYVCRFEYEASQLRWNDTGDSFDVVAVKRA